MIGLATAATTVHLVLTVTTGRDLAVAWVCPLATLALFMLGGTVCAGAAYVTFIPHVHSARS
jgi:hypothetical protein